MNIDLIKKHFQETHFDLAVVLGSGLSHLSESLEDSKSLAYQKIEGLLAPEVSGHKGELIYGTLKKRKILIFSGRVHMYEGHGPYDVTCFVRLAHLLGIKKIIITNAAGAINPQYKVGQAILIKDHINFTGKNPLIGKNNDQLGERFPEMSNAYDESLRSKVSDLFDQEGVYAGVLGPSFETSAEVRMLGLMGADLVGMSTVMEVIMANYLKMNTLAFSLVTNEAQGIGSEKLSHEDVKKAASESRNSLQELFKNILDRI